MLNGMHLQTLSCFLLGTYMLVLGRSLVVPMEPGSGFRGCVERIDVGFVGRNSGLHIIIFDEIDAICKQRGSAAGSTGVHDTIVNQLLAKMDGVDQLNNILVIGMEKHCSLIMKVARNESSGLLQV